MIPQKDLIKHLKADRDEATADGAPKRRAYRQVKELVIILKEKGVLTVQDVQRIKDVQ